MTDDGVPREQVVVRRNGVDLTEFEHVGPLGAFRRELGLSGGEFLILSLGRLSRKKGLDLLLRAFALLPQQSRLAIVGPDDRDGCPEELKALRSRLGLEGRVVLSGPRFGARKVEAMRDADLFVLPSRNENFGNVVAEAIACEVPVVVTDRCGIAPYVDGRVGLVVPPEEEPLRAALHRMMTDDGLRGRCAANAAVLKRELSWDAPIAQMETLYAQLVETGQAGPPR